MSNYDGYSCDYNGPAKHDMTVLPPAPQPQIYNQNVNHTTVQMGQPVTPMMVQVDVKPRWSWALTITSVLTTLFCGACGCLWGFLGILQATHSYIDHKSGDYSRSANKRRCGWGFVITGLVLGVIGWIIIFIGLGEAMSVAHAVVKQAQQYRDNNNG